MPEIAGIIGTQAGGVVLGDSFGEILSVADVMTA
jgi:hypothetical protein